jgi:nitroreductase
MADASDVVRLLKRVHQTRSFTDQAVPKDVVNDLLQVARWTGSARNVQPWHFVVIDDRQELEELSTIGKSATFFREAPVVIAVVIEAESPQPAFDEARVIERLFIAAAAHGLSAGIGTFSPGNIPLAGEILKLPEGLKFHAGVAIGQAATRESKSSSGSARKPLESIVHHGTFGTAFPS